MGVRRAPWWERLAEALKYVYENHVRYDGRALSLSGGPLGNRLVRRELVATGAITPLFRLYSDEGVRLAFNKARGEKGLSPPHHFQVAYELDPDRVDAVRRQLLMQKPRSRVVWRRLRDQVGLALEFEEGVQPDFRWDES